MQEEAKVDYLNGMKYREIAEKYNVSINTVKSWKKRHAWCRDAPVKVAPKEGCTQKQVRPKLAEALKGNQNAVGNNGGAPRGNHNAMTHGLYAKYLPDETREIAKGFGSTSPLDLLWDAICLKYAAIIRAQQIMHVTDKNEIIEHVKSMSDTSTTYEFQFAWDRQASFMTAQAKAMTALTNMFKQYDELCRSDLVTEEQRLRIAKLKMEIAAKDEGGSEAASAMQELADSLNKARQNQ